MKKYLANLILVTIDSVTLIGIFYLTFYVRSSLYGISVPKFTPIALDDFFFIIFIIIALFIYEKIYTLRYDFWQELRKIFRAVALAYFIVLALLALSKISLEYSRLFITIYFALVMLLLPVVKRYTKKILYMFPLFKNKVLIVGDKDQTEILKKEFDKNWYLGMQYSREKYDIVIVASKGLSLKHIDEKIEKYLDNNSSVYVVPYVTNINFSNSNILEYSNIRLNTIQIENKLLIKKNIWIKELFDYTVLILTIPLFLILHIMISLSVIFDSKGSVFFKQERLGKNGQIFLCYKYRTMYEGSEGLLKEYLKNNPDEVEYYSIYHKYKNDPRITKVGKVLRSTSLDELAQIINVLRGDMSLVGPRPYMTSESFKLGKSKEFILKVKPGITGLWQVSGRNNLSFKQRNELEVWYIKNWSLWADFVILIKTVKVVLGKIGAK